MHVVSSKFSSNVALYTTISSKYANTGFHSLSAITASTSRWNVALPFLTLIGITKHSKALYDKRVLSSGWRITPSELANILLSSQFE